MLGFVIAQPNLEGICKKKMKTEVKGGKPVACLPITTRKFCVQGVCMTRKAYPTDLTDKQWEIISPLLPGAKSERERGRKRHILVDTLGLVLVVIVHAANMADVTAGGMLLAESSLSVPTRQQVWADRGYRGERLQQVAQGCDLN